MPATIDAYLRGRLRTMNILKDSSFYQVLLKEGREVGLREGEMKGVRKSIFRQGRIRFGRLPRTTRAAIDAIDDPDRLERHSERVLTATSWDDLLATKK
jgi:predicted transposase YdaD